MRCQEGSRGVKRSQEESRGFMGSRGFKKNVKSKELKGIVMGN